MHAFWQLHIFGQWGSCAIVGSNPLHGDARMPLSLTDAERAMLDSLAAPVDASRRLEFMGAVEKELEAQGAAAVGPGAVHRAAREILGGFWSPPPDLRVGRLGPRGPRS
jgi:hypothetical protein